MSGMAAVLAAHWAASTHSDRKPFVDKCDGCGAVIYSWGGDPTPDGIEPLAAHQAAMLTAAGFGPVKKAKAVALEEAADELERRAKNVQNNTYVESSIYVELTHGADALLGAAETARARAAAVRGEP